MASADFCPVTPRVAAGRAAGSGGRVRWRIRAFRRGPQSGSRNPLRPPAGQTSPNKDMNFHCTTAAFTLCPVSADFVIWCWLIRALALPCDSCSSARSFALGLPSDKPSRTCPCRRL